MIRIVRSFGSKEYYIKEMKEMKIADLVKQRLFLISNEMRITAAPRAPSPHPLITSTGLKTLIPYFIGQTPSLGPVTCIFVKNLLIVFI